MRIGIDAKWYFEGPPSGRRVIRSLVEAMLTRDTQNEYVIFLNAKQRDREFTLASKQNVTVCYVWSGNNMLSNIFVLPRHANTHKLDVVLYQNFISPFGKDKRVAYIHDVLFLSNPEYYTWIERLYMSPVRFLTHRAHAVVTVSHEEKKRLLEYHIGGNAEQIAVAHHGVDRDFMPLELQDPTAIRAAREKFKLPDEFLLFVGRLNLRKNIDTLLRAIPMLKNKTIPLVIVGADNWKKSNHEEIVRALNIENRIHFTGAVFQELGLIYSLAKVFCFPSYAESFGLPPLEAMASGVPVVVSNTTSLPEVCGEAGTYASPNDPSAIAAAIDNLLANDQLYTSRKRLGLEQAKKFTWDAAAQSVISCLESCRRN